MERSFHDFRDYGGDIILDDNIGADVDIGGCVIDNDQMRAVVKGLQG